MFSLTLDMWLSHLKLLKDNPLRGRIRYCSSKQYPNFTPVVFGTPEETMDPGLQLQFDDKCDKTARRLIPIIHQEYHDISRLHLTLSAWPSYVR